MKFFLFFKSIALATVLVLYNLSATLTAVAEVDGVSSLEINDGERIVMIGSTLIEQAQKFGYIETAILAANPEKKITVRNLGWSADDVFGTSRGRFGFQPEGFRHLVHHVTELKPTLVLFYYGANEAFAGDPGIHAFRKGLKALLDALAVTEARFVFLSPHKQEALGGKLPDPASYNEKLAAYVDVLEKTAAERGDFYVDLYGGLLVKDSASSSNPALTYNGRHLTEDGQRKLAEVIAESMRFPVPQWEQFDAMRNLIIKKNRLYFHRWRPQNETYLTLFRKHEQGNNFREIPQFDPMILAVEKEIQKLQSARADAP